MQYTEAFPLMKANNRDIKVTSHSENCSITLLMQYKTKWVENATTLEAVPLLLNAGYRRYTASSVTGALAGLTQTVTSYLDYG